MIIRVTPDEAIRLQDAAMRADLTIDGSFNETEWERNVRAIFGDAATNRMCFAGPVQVVVDYDATTIPESERLTLAPLDIGASAVVE